MPATTHKVTRGAGGGGRGAGGTDGCDAPDAALRLGDAFDAAHAEPHADGALRSGGSQRPHKRRGARLRLAAQEPQLLMYGTKKLETCLQFAIAIEVLLVSVSFHGPAPRGTGAPRRTRRVEACVSVGEALSLGVLALHASKLGAALDTGANSGPVTAWLGLVTAWPGPQGPGPRAGEPRPPAALDGPRDHRTEPTRDAHHGRAQQLETGPVGGSTHPPPPLPRAAGRGGGWGDGRAGESCGKSLGRGGAWETGVWRDQVVEMGGGEWGGAGERG